MPSVRVARCHGNLQLTRESAAPRSLPCEWGPDNSIVVLDSVTIKAPYTPDDCTGTETYTLERVKKVVCHVNREQLDA
jgi:hypothetical protein